MTKYSSQRSNSSRSVRRRTNIINDNNNNSDKNNKNNNRQSGSNRASSMAALSLLLLLGAGNDVVVSAFSPSGGSRTAFRNINNNISIPATPISNNNILNNNYNYKHNPSSASSSSTCLHATPMSPSLSALTSTISGGLFSGSLHAIAGPDHLAALIPRCCGLPWYKAARVGAVWGMGHGVSATLLGMCGYLFKKGVRLSGILGGRFASSLSGDNFNLLHHAGSFMELMIGISLIVIGLLGIKEAKEWEAPTESACEVVDSATVATEGAASASASTPQSLSSAATPAAAIPTTTTTTTTTTPNPAKRAVLFNGILHGFSWDGAPSLAPAVAISTWRGSLTFLLSYAFGTMAAMTVATTLIGEGTRRASFHLDRPDLPRDLSVASSFLALVVGIVWCWLALK